MSIVVLVLVALYAALDAVLANAVRTAPRIAAVFALAATALGCAALTRSTAALVVGLALSSAGPLLVGALLHGRVRPAHHLLRAVGSCVIVLLWVATS